MSERDWNTQASNRAGRLARAASLVEGKHVPAATIKALLEAVIEPGDRVCLEGNNQKQADFLARALVSVDPDRVHDLHMVQSVLALPEHLEIFERGIASKLDFSFSGPQGGRVARLVGSGRLEIGAIHTYLELFGRYFVDLTPKVSLIAVQAADRAGNLYTGPNTEDTPAIVEATAFKSGIVIAQANEIVDRLPRVDVPADWVDFVVESPAPHYIEPLFTRDPANITEIQVLMAMLAIKGIYAQYGVNRLNHGIGFDTAAIELLLPTYAADLGLKGKICQHWALNPHPALIPAIEAGFVESIHSFGSELGMENYIAARRDVFFTGPDGSMRSNRALCQAAGHYACDMFIGSTLQIDLGGNSSTATLGRIAGFGGAPNMGADARGRSGRQRRQPGDATRSETGGADGGDVPRTHAADFRRAARRLGIGRDRQHGIAAGDDLRRRRHTHRDGRRHRQPAVVPRRRGACARDSRCSRIYRGRVATRPAHRRKPARPRRHPTRRRPRHRQASGKPRSARRALDQRSGACVRWPVRAARSVSQLVSGLMLRS